MRPTQTRLRIWQVITVCLALSLIALYVAHRRQASRLEQVLRIIVESEFEKDRVFAEIIDEVRRSFDDDNASSQAN